jgi:hypothetical protein
MAHAERVHSTTLPNSSALKVVFVTAGVQLLNMRAHRIVGEPDHLDAAELVSNLQRLAEIIDPVIAAIGAYAVERYGMVDRSRFTNVLLGAIDGEATFAIEVAAEHYYLEMRGLR